MFVLMEPNLLLGTCRGHPQQYDSFGNDGRMHLQLAFQFHTVVAIPGARPNCHTVEQPT